MPALKISAVECQGWTEFGAFQGMGSDDRAICEVYTGNIVVAFEQGGNSIVRLDFQTFLPFDGTTLRFYPPQQGPWFDPNILVAPIGFTAHEDEEFVCSIDEYKLDVEPQTFPGIMGTKLCWVLRFKAALLNGTLHRVGYHVFLKRFSLDVTQERVPSNSKPA